MNRKQNLLDQVRGLLRKKPNDERYIYYALTDRFYSFDEVDETKLFIPKKDAKGVKDENLLLHGQCVRLGNGVDIYF